jgi:hypothetical protein
VWGIPQGMVCLNNAQKAPKAPFLMCRLADHWRSVETYPGRIRRTADPSTASSGVFISTSADAFPVVGGRYTGRAAPVQGQAGPSWHDGPDV